MTGNISQSRYRIGGTIKTCNKPYKEYVIYPGFPDGCNNYIYNGQSIGQKGNRRYFFNKGKFPSQLSIRINTNIFQHYISPKCGNLSLLKIISQKK
jgi:hypothetical protein